MADLDDTRPKELDTKQVLRYVEDLKALLSTGILLGQKAILRLFIKRIDFNPDQVTIHYTIPMPIEEDRKSNREVLSIRKNGGPYCTVLRTFNLAFSLVV